MAVPGRIQSSNGINEASFVKRLVQAMTRESEGGNLEKLDGHKHVRLNITNEMN